jgi:hypothetical protein
MGRHGTIKGIIRADGTLSMQSKGRGFPLNVLEGQGVSFKYQARLVYFLKGFGVLKRPCIHPQQLR